MTQQTNTAETATEVIKDLEPAIDMARQAVKDNNGDYLDPQEIGVEGIGSTHKKLEPNIMFGEEDQEGTQFFTARDAIRDPATGKSVSYGTKVIATRDNDTSQIKTRIIRQNEKGEETHRFESTNPNTSRRVGKLVAKRLVQNASSGDSKQVA